MASNIVSELSLLAKDSQSHDFYVMLLINLRKEISRKELSGKIKERDAVQYIQLLNDLEGYFAKFS